MSRSLPHTLLTGVAVAALALAAGCGDDDGADPTPEALGGGDRDVTVPRDDDGAVGEPDDEDSQTDSTQPGSGDDVVARSGTARVVGSFGDGDLDLLLTDDATCAIEDTSDAGAESAAEVSGQTAEGEAFTLDWSIADGTLRSTLEQAERTWTADVDLDAVSDPQVQLTRSGEVLLDTTYEAADGETAEAQLFVNCRPES